MVLDHLPRFASVHCIAESGLYDFTCDLYPIQSIPSTQLSDSSGSSVILCKLLETSISLLLLPITLFIGHVTVDAPYKTTERTHYGGSFLFFNWITHGGTSSRLPCSPYTSAQFKSPVMYMGELYFNYTHFVASQRSA